MPGFIENFGSWFIKKLDNFFNISAYTFLIIKTMIQKKSSPKKTAISVLFKQILFTGVDALPVIAMVALAVGAVSIVQSFSILPKFGGESFIGKILITVIIRELGPLLTGFIVISRSGTAITTEIGNMVVSHEIEALESMGIDPVRYIVIPRVLGVTISLVSLNIYFDMLAILGGFFVSKMVIVTSLIIFLQKMIQAMVLSDLTISLLKGIIFGVVISIICTFYGFSVKLSSTEVPQMTTRAVVNSIILLFLTDGIVTFIYYMQ